MASQGGNRAANRTKRSVENGDTDASGTSEYPNAANGGAHERAIVGFGADLRVHTFDRLPEPYVGPMMFQDFAANVEYYTDLETYLPAASAEESGVLGEDYIRADSFSWEELPKFGGSVSYQNVTSTVGEVGQDQIFDIGTIPQQQGGLPIRPFMANNVAINDSQNQPRGPRSRSPTALSHYVGLNPADSDGKIDCLRDPTNEGISLPHQLMDDAYRQLECNYKFTPHPTIEQIRALSTLVKLPFHQVQAFYREKNSKAVAQVLHAPYSEQVPNIPNPAKRHRGSDSSSFELLDSTYGTYNTDPPTRHLSSEKSAIPRVSSLKSNFRKHSQKSYHCTWPACPLSFASKSDWKRHEEVHVPQWRWVCTFGRAVNGKRSTIVPCSSKFKRDDHLREHLKSHHNCTEYAMIAAGREPLEPKSPFNSQCGFCGELTPEWLDRINHIAEHFRAGKHISEWKMPWQEDAFENGFKPRNNDDDEEPDTDRNGTDNSTSENGSDPRAKPGGGSRKDFNNTADNGRYPTSGTQYVRSGVFGVKYQSENQSLIVVRKPKPGYDSPVIDGNEPLIPFWRKMRSLFKYMTMRRGTAPASAHHTSGASSEAPPERDHQYGERIDFYCILCLKITSADCSSQSANGSQCTCSEAAIQDHVWSLIKTNSSPPSETKLDSGELTQKVPKIQVRHGAQGEMLERDKLFKRHLLHAVGGLPVEHNELKRLATLNDDQYLHGADAYTEDESLSYSMRRYLKLSCPTECASDWIDIPGDSKSLQGSLPDVTRFVR